MDNPKHHPVNGSTVKNPHEEFAEEQIRAELEGVQCETKDDTHDPLWRFGLDNEDYIF